MTVSQTHTTIRWAARVATVPIFLFWGAFFLEHFSGFPIHRTFHPFKFS